MESESFWLEYTIVPDGYESKELRLIRNGTPIVVPRPGEYVMY